MALQACTSQLLGTCPCALRWPKVTRTAGEGRASESLTCPAHRGNIERVWMCNLSVFDCSWGNILIDYGGEIRVQAAFNLAKVWLKIVLFGSDMLATFCDEAKIRVTDVDGNSSSAHAQDYAALPAEISSIFYWWVPDSTFLESLLEPFVSFYLLFINFERFQAVQKVRSGEKV